MTKSVTVTPLDGLVKEVVQIIDGLADSPAQDVNDVVRWLLSKRSLEVLESVYNRPAAWIRDHWRTKKGAPRVYPQANGLALFDVLEAYEFIKSTSLPTKEQRGKTNKALNQLASGANGQRSPGHVHRLVHRSDA